LTANRPFRTIANPSTERAKEENNMRFGKVTFYTILLVAFALLFAVSCGDDDDDDDDDNDDDSDDDDSTDDDDAVDDDDDTSISDLIQEGKDWLAFPDGDKARLSFLAALEVIPDHPEALYGLTLADTVHTCDIFSVILDYVMSVIDYGGPVKKKELSGDDLINTLLQKTLDGLLGDRVHELIETADKTRELGGTFEHWGIPIFIHYEVVDTLSTEFDDGELYASQAFAGLFFGLAHHLYALDMDFDLSHLFGLENVPIDELETQELIALFIERLLGMLEDPTFPTFLTIPEENADVFREAGAEVATALDHWLKAFTAVNLESDDQTDDVIAYVDENGNGYYTDGEPYVIPHYGQLDQEQTAWLTAINAIVAGARDSLWDYTVNDVDPANPNAFQVALLNDVLKLIGLPRIIPRSWEIDMGAWYIDPAGSGLRDFLLTLLRLVDLFLPDYQW
jgi:hypothetical protein